MSSYGLLRGIKLGVQSNDEIRRRSTAHVFRLNPYEKKTARHGGIHDPRMGPSDRSAKCVTDDCLEACPTHHGHSELPLGFHIYTLSVDKICKLLRCVCFYCYESLVPRDVIAFLDQQDAEEGKEPGFQRFKRCLEACKNCRKCGIVSTGTKRREKAEAAFMAALLPPPPSPSVPAGSSSSSSSDEIGVQDAPSKTRKKTKGKAKKKKRLHTELNKEEEEQQGQTVTIQTETEKEKGNKNKKGCGRLQPVFSVIGNFVHAVFTIPYTGSVDKNFLFPNFNASIVHKVFRGISDEDLHNLGIETKLSHPREWIKDVIRIPEPAIRLGTIQNESSKNRGEHEISIWLRNLMKLRECLRERMYVDDIQDLDQQLPCSHATYIWEVPFAYLTDTALEKCRTIRAEAKVRSDVKKRMIRSKTALVLCMCSGAPAAAVALASASASRYSAVLTPPPPVAATVGRVRTSPFCTCLQTFLRDPADKANPFVLPAIPRPLLDPVHAENRAVPVYKKLHKRIPPFHELLVDLQNAYFVTFDGQPTKQYAATPSSAGVGYLTPRPEAKLPPDLLRPPPPPTTTLVPVPPPPVAVHVPPIATIATNAVPINTTTATNTANKKANPKRIKNPNGKDEKTSEDEDEDTEKEEISSVSLNKTTGKTPVTTKKAPTVWPRSANPRPKSQIRKGARCAGTGKQLKGKAGHVHKYCSGKRVNLTARTVAVGSNEVDAVQIGLPVEIASELCRKVKVTAFNIHQLTARLRAGKVIVIYKTENEEEEEEHMYTVRDPATDTLQIGWRVARQLEDGDPILYNRQPSLHCASMLAGIVYICAKLKTVVVPEAADKALNLDHDGDEINLHSPSSTMAQIEAFLLCDLMLQMLSRRGELVLLTPVFNGVLGIYRLTRPDCFFTRDQFIYYLSLFVSPIHTQHWARKFGFRRSALDGPCLTALKTRLFADASCPFDETQDPEAALVWRGSLVLAHLFQRHLFAFPEPVGSNSRALQTPRDNWETTDSYETYTGGNETYTSGNEPNTGSEQKWQGSQLLESCLPLGFQLESPGDGNRMKPLSIRNGKMCSEGPLGAAHIQMICHRLAQDWGCHVGTYFASGINRIANILVENQGATVGFDDCRPADLPLSAQRSERVCDFLSHVPSHAADLFQTPNIKHANSSETRICDLLNTVFESNGEDSLRVRRRIREPNNLKELADSGTKGKSVNLIQIWEGLGPNAELGKRMVDVPPHYSQQPLHPEAHGMVCSSFFTGLDVCQYGSHAKPGWGGTVTTSIETADNGFRSKQMNRALDLRVENDSTVRNGDRLIVQYGSDAFNPQHLEYCSFPLFDSSRVGDITMRYTLPGYEKTGWMQHEVLQLKRGFVLLHKAAALLARKAVNRFTLPLPFETILLALKTRTLPVQSSSTARSQRATPRQIHEFIRNMWFQDLLPLTTLNQRPHDLRHCAAASNDDEKEDRDDGDEKEDDEMLGRKQQEQKETYSLLELACWDWFNTRRLFEMGIDQGSLVWLSQVCQAYLKNSLTQYGEMIGILAVQSVAEPAMQMTLNVFHTAGKSSPIVAGTTALKQHLTLATPEPVAWLVPATDTVKPKNLARSLVFTLLKSAVSRGGGQVFPWSYSRDSQNKLKKEWKGLLQCSRLFRTVTHTVPSAASDFRFPFVISFCLSDTCLTSTKHVLRQCLSYLFAKAKTISLPFRQLSVRFGLGDRTFLLAIAMEHPLVLKAASNCIEFEGKVIPSDNAPSLSMAYHFVRTLLEDEVDISGIRGVVSAQTFKLPAPFPGACAVNRIRAECLLNKNKMSSSLTSDLHDFYTMRSLDSALAQASTQALPVQSSSSSSSSASGSSSSAQTNTALPVQGNDLFQEHAFTSTNTTLIRVNGTSLVSLLSASGKHGNSFEKGFLFSSDLMQNVLVYGIEAARSILETMFVYNMRDTSCEQDYRHITLICDSMAHSGTLLPISNSGTARSHSSVLRSAIYEQFYKWILTAAMHGTADPCTGTTESILLLKKLRGGTAMSTAVYDESMTASYNRDYSDLIQTEVVPIPRCVEHVRSWEPTRPTLRSQLNILPQLDNKNEDRLAIQYPDFDDQTCFDASRMMVTSREVAFEHNHYVREERKPVSKKRKGITLEEEEQATEQELLTRLFEAMEDRELSLSLDLLPLPAFEPRTP